MTEQIPNPTTDYPVGTVLACPACGSTEHLGELETVEAISDAEQITVGEEELLYEWSGHKDYFDENCKTIGVVCRKCNWQGQETELVAAGDALSQRRRRGQSVVNGENDLPTPTAELHSRFLMDLAAGDLVEAAPDAEISEFITAADPYGGQLHDGGLSYELEIPDDERDREVLAVEFAARLAADDAVAAGMIWTVFGGDGRRDTARGETVFVFASDHEGGEEAWSAEVVRSDDASPELREWQRASSSDAFMLMLHLGVRNLAGIRRFAQYPTIPRAFAGLQLGAE